ncbi:head-tail connector protein [Actinomadura sediminis]|uniref:Big-1 domain-containing protein n=1 Tax=Actinomadura sediminis TaxID=1038904 RepID=A0ABW3EPQ8_9ACTN
MYDLGAVVPLTLTVRDSTGNLADAGSVSVTVTLPDGATVVEGPVTSTTTGVYEYGYATTAAGRHVVRWVATGVNATASTDMFDVLAADPGQIVSLSDAKKHLNIPATSTTDDAELRDFVLAATAVVERYVGAVARREHVETFDGGRPDLVLSHAPVLSVSAVVEDGETVAASGYALDAPSGVLRRVLAGAGSCWRGGVGGVEVTYLAGRTSVPANVSRAALIIVKHMWDTQRGSGGSRPLLGESEAVALNPGGTGYAIPYRALELLGEPVAGVA